MSQKSLFQFMKKPPKEIKRLTTQDLYFKVTALQQQQHLLDKAQECEQLEQWKEQKALQRQTKQVDRARAQQLLQGRHTGVIIRRGRLPHSSHSQQLQQQQQQLQLQQQQQLQQQVQSAVQSMKSTFEGNYRPHTTSNPMNIMAVRIAQLRNQDQNYRLKSTTQASQFQNDSTLQQQQQQQQFEQFSQQQQLSEYNSSVFPYSNIGQLKQEYRDERWNQTERNLKSQNVEQIQQLMKSKMSTNYGHLLRGLDTNYTFTGYQTINKNQQQLQQQQQQQPQQQQGTMNSQQQQGILGNGQIASIISQGAGLMYNPLEVKKTKKKKKRSRK